MVVVDKIENHIFSKSVSELKVLREELQWYTDNSVLNASHIIDYIDKALNLRGELIDRPEPKKILMMCNKCNFSSIYDIEPPYDNANEKIFNLMLQPCPRCKNIGQYGWKYME